MAGAVDGQAERRRDRHGQEQVQEPAWMGQPSPARIEPHDGEPEQQGSPQVDDVLERVDSVASDRCLVHRREMGAPHHPGVQGPSQHGPAENPPDRAVEHG